MTTTPNRPSVERMPEPSYPWSLWLCSVSGHGLHDEDYPCPLGVLPPEDVGLCFHSWGYDSAQDAWVCTKRCGAARPN